MRNLAIASGAREGQTGISRRRPTSVQRRWLSRGLGQPGGKLPLFDENGQEINPQTIISCIRQGWAEPWIRNPIKPDWLVCRLTGVGRGIRGVDPDS